MFKLTSLIVAMSLSIPVLAEMHPIDRQSELCLEKTDVTAEMLDCLNLAYQSWDTELNKQYDRLLNSANDAQKVVLQSSQQAWITYRDSYLKALTSYYSSQEGTMWSLIYSSNAVDLTKQKALSLQQLRESVCVDASATCD